MTISICIFAGIKTSRSDYKQMAREKWNKYTKVSGDTRNGDFEKEWIEQQRQNHRKFVLSMVSIRLLKHLFQAKNNDFFFARLFQYSACVFVQVFFCSRMQFFFNERCALTNSSQVFGNQWDGFLSVSSSSSSFSILFWIINPFVLCILRFVPLFFLSHYENYWHNRFRIFKLFCLFSSNHDVGGMSMCIILHSTSFVQKENLEFFFCRRCFIIITLSHRSYRKQKSQRHGVGPCFRWWRWCNFLLKWNTNT